MQQKEVVRMAMLHMGRGVLMIEPDEKVKRAGEGGFIRLKDGTILLMYTKMVGASDFSSSRLSAVYSRDEGETWKITGKMIIAMWTPRWGRTISWRRTTILTVQRNRCIA